MDGFIEIPFGAEDSELKGWEYTIPDDMEAEIKDGKIIVRQKENKDEKIRKNILALVKKHAVNHERVRMEDWLEKQKEQKPAEIVRIPKFRVGDIVQHVGEKWDRTMRIADIDEWGYYYDFSHHGDPVIGGGFSFACEDEYELVEQQPVEWSEEDIDKMVNARSGKSGTTKSEMEFYRQGIKDTLRSIRQQPRWKPSEAQKNALKEVLDMADAYGILQKMGRTYDDIIELQNDLEEEF